MNRIKLIGALLAMLVCAACQSQAAAVPKPPAISPAEEKLVTFDGASGAKIHGTLLLPAGAGKFPAIVLVAGSGPTDRNGNQLPAIKTDLLKQIAQALAEKGIATLRYDKRGMNANAAELPANKSKWVDFFTWENFAGDVEAGVTYLRGQEQIDPAHVGIAGHSEGGLLALTAADLLKPAGNAPAVLILLSTPGRTMDVVVGDQIERGMKKNNTPQKTMDFYLSENARLAKAIRETGKFPADVPPELMSIYPPYLVKFFRSEFTLNAPKLAADFAGPVLIMAGGRDIQVSPELDAKALLEALKLRPKDDHAMHIVGGASHNLKMLISPDDPGFEGRVDPVTMARIVQWAAEKLKP